ncbi:MAG: biopolymer transporter ExbD [Candidatus Aminicenantes bacterium]|jgi:biopolymer transport protein TolR
MAVSVSTGEEEVKSEPNVVPLCDVLLVLLIIFMVVTPLVKKGVDVRLPTALHMIDFPENPELVLSIKRDGTMFLNQDQVTRENLTAMLEEVMLTASDKKLYLRADQDLEFGNVVEIIAPLKEAGIEVVGIIAEKKTEGSDLP